MSEDKDVTAIIEHSPSARTVRIPLGKWHDVWSEGVSVGSHPDCTIRLGSDEIYPVQVRLSRQGHHHYLKVVEGSVSCVGRTESTPGASWRISGIGDPEPIDVGPFRVVITTRESEEPPEEPKGTRPWWKLWSSESERNGA
jgi:hypothetical protein